MTDATAPAIPEVICNVKAHKHDGLVAKSTIILDCSQLQLALSADPVTQLEGSTSEGYQQDAPLLAFAHVIVLALGRERVFEMHVYPEPRTIEIVIPTYFLQEATSSIAHYCAHLGCNFSH